MTAGTLTPNGVGFDPLKDKTYQSTRLGRDVADFLAWLELGGASPKTLLNYEPDLARGALMFPDKGLADLTDGDVLHIASSFPPKSRRARMAAWRSFYKWALRTRRYAGPNPCDALPDMKPNPQKVIDVFSEAEIEALYGLPVRDAAPIAVLMEAGLRKAEARGLKLLHCLPESWDVKVLADPTSNVGAKGNRERVVPMSDRLHRLLNDLMLLEGLRPVDHVFYAVKRNQQPGFEKILRDKPVGEGTFHRWWERCLKQAGVRYRSPHTARHTYATRLRRENVAIDDLRILLGHASITTTESIYVHSRIDEVRARLVALGVAGR